MSKSADRNARILLVGDISLGGDFADLVARGGATWTSPFDEVLPLFRDADIRVGNLESPLFKSLSPRRKRNLLHAPGDAVETLTHLGFTILSLANNHITDQSDEGVENTRALLAAHQIHARGAGVRLDQASSVTSLCVNGYKLTMFGYTVLGGDVGAEGASAESAGAVPFSIERAEADLEAARDRNEQAIVSIHWGYQYDEFPSPDQIAIARRLINAGALIVHGHHPHVLQGFERYRHGLILYSLGNFFFPDFLRADGIMFRFPKSARRTGAVLCTVGNAGVESVSFIPMEFVSPGRLRLLEGHRAEKAISAHETRSKLISQPDYANQWRRHHERTVRSRELQEARIGLAAQAHQLRTHLFSQNITRTLVRLRPRHLVEAFRMCARSVRLFTRSSGL